MCKRPEVDDKHASAALAEVSADTAKSLAPTHSDIERNTKWDFLIFLGPLAFAKLTPVWTIYSIAIARILVVHVFISLHYQLVDKDNYLNKLTQKQLKREKDDYLTAFLLHMYSQIALQLIFPSMFFSDNSEIAACIFEALMVHVFFVEPLYYFVHKWLHIPEVMKQMHGFHHLSIRTMPTTALVQNFHEHFVYIATFGPAFLLPFFLQGRQHWVAIGVYLVSFDIINMWGHTNVKVRNPIFTSKYSPITYLFYTPEFHLGHHAYFNANYTLFMPIWDYLFGTARHYEKKDTQKLLPPKQQDFVFIGHNGGLGHFLLIPELNPYNVYEEYKQYLPLKYEFLIMHAVRHLFGLFSSFYYCSRFCVANDKIGRIICLLRTPIDYMSPKSYAGVNKDMIRLMTKEHKEKGTRYYGLGNLNKMKQLNDGGVDIVRMVEQDEYLKDKNIRIWTGDTMTVASVYNQILDVPNLTEFYYVGAGGKIGTAVCEKLVRDHPHIKIRIFSRNAVLKHDNISYSTDLSEMANYKLVLVGKILSPKMYNDALKKAKNIKTGYVLDYTVPAMPIPALKARKIQHVRIGLLRTTDPKNPFLRGHYDVCMSTPENHIVPCHFGCLLNTVEGRETHEVGEIDQNQVDRMWKMTVARGFENISIDYQ